MALKSNCLVLVAVGALLARPASLSVQSWASPVGAVEVETHSGVKPICLPASETRDAVKAHKLLEPFAVLKAAATQLKAEALSAKLCHFGDDYVYEIALLHRDGRLIHVVTNAATGKIISSRNLREPQLKN